MNRAKGKGEVVGMGMGRDRRSGRHDQTRSWVTAPQLSLFSILVFPLPFLSTTSPSYNHSSPLPFISANVSTTAPSSQVLSCWSRGQRPLDCPASRSTLDSPPCPSRRNPVYSVFLRQRRCGEIGIPQGRRRRICAPGEGVDLSQCASKINLCPFGDEDNANTRRTRLCSHTRTRTSITSILSQKTCFLLLFSFFILTFLPYLSPTFGTSYSSCSGVCLASVGPILISFFLSFFFFFLFSSLQFPLSDLFLPCFWFRSGSLTLLFLNPTSSCLKPFFISQF